MQEPVPAENLLERDAQDARNHLGERAVEEKKSIEKTGAPTLQTVERALSFLEYVAAQPEPPNVQSVSEALGLNITTCYHLMRTLIKQNYLKRLTRGKLVLGSAIVPLYRAYRLRVDVNREMTDIVTRLSERTGETAFFSSLEGDSVLLGFLAHGSHQLRVGGIHVGMTGNEHLRASARAILPYVDDEARGRILEKSLAKLPAAEASEQRALFVAAMQETRARGWSTDGGFAPGVSGLGWPIFDSQNAIYGAIGLIVPTWRLERSEEELLKELSSAASQAMQLS